MKKLKWKYNDKFLKDYHTEIWGCKDFRIEKDASNTHFLFQKAGLTLIGSFRKLKDAKACAQLIHNG